MINREVVEAFWAVHPDAENRLIAWLNEADRASWRTSMDIKQQYGSASILGNRRVVFNIRGNRYRMVVAVRYTTEESEGTVFIKFAGTHEEYDAIDPVKI